MDFSFPPDVEGLRARLLEFMDSHVYPAEPVSREQLASSADPYASPPVMGPLGQLTSSVQVSLNCGLAARV